MFLSVLICLTCGLFLFAQVREAPGETQAVRVAESVLRSHLLYYVEPHFPEVNPAAELPVLLEVTAEYGKIWQANPIRGLHDEFVQAAVEAVRKWRFTPIVVNGTPIRAKAVLRVGKRAPEYVRDRTLPVTVRFDNDSLSDASFRLTGDSQGSYADGVGGSALASSTVDSGLIRALKGSGVAQSWCIRTALCPCSQTRFSKNEDYAGFSMDLVLLLRVCCHWVSERVVNRHSPWSSSLLDATKLS